MKKKFFSILPALLLLCLFLTLTATAAGAPRLVDDADLLTTSEETVLRGKLDRYSEKYGMDVVIVTTYDYLGYDVDAYAENYYDTHGYNPNGVMLLIGMSDRDWVITATGEEGMKIFSEDAREYLSDAFLSDLSDGNYADALNTFADMSASLLSDAKNGKYYKTPFGWSGAIIAGLIAGLIVAAVYVGKLKNDLISVRTRKSASDYVVRDSLQVTRSRDTFLYRTVSRVVIQSSSSSSRSSSGSSSSHSSSHGKF